MTEDAWGALVGQLTEDELDELITYMGSIG